MPADVYAVAFVIDGPRYAPHIGAFLKHDNFDRAAGDKLKGGGQTCWPGAYDYSFFVRLFRRQWQNFNMGCA